MAAGHSDGCRAVRPGKTRNCFRRSNFEPLGPETASRCVFCAVVRADATPANEIGLQPCQKRFSA
eukprot:14995707-Alexandrium_andersonii.AAC.1